MRSTMRRVRTSIRCSLSLSLRARSIRRCCKPRCRRWWGGTPACGRASGMSSLSRSGAGGAGAGRGAVAADRSVGAATAAQQQAAAGEILAADRLERFDLGGAAVDAVCADPAWRGRAHRLLISNHHLLMDGWSAPILVRELLQAYAQGGSVASLPRVTPYRDYLSFIARQDRDGGACGLAGGAGRPRGGHAACAAPWRQQARCSRAHRCARADRAVAGRGAERGAQPHARASRR